MGDRASLDEEQICKGPNISHTRLLVAPTYDAARKKVMPVIARGFPHRGKHYALQPAGNAQ